MTYVYVLLHDSPDPEHGHNTTDLIEVYSSDKKARKEAKDWAEKSATDCHDKAHVTPYNMGFYVQDEENEIIEAWYVIETKLLD